MHLHLTVAHFDHGMRGARAARREATAVRSLCDALGVPLRTGRADVREVARNARLSIEDAARRERYAFLARVAVETTSTAVATGHTASDQAETVLLHLIRGAGLAGIAGIAAASIWPFLGHGQLSLLRPLLQLSRADTVAVCAAYGIEPVEDESNASPRFRRNRVRQQVLPLLRDLNPGVEAALARLAAAARDSAAFAEDVARPLLRSLPEPDAPVPLRPDLSAARRAVASRLPRTLASMPAAVRHAGIRLALLEAGGDTQEFTQRHYDAIDHLLLAGKTGDSLDLPRGLLVDVEDGAVVISAGGRSIVRLPPAPEELALGAYVTFGPFAVSVMTMPPATGAWAAVDASALEGGIVVRRRREGDRFQPMGMEGTKKLQDFLVDAHIPRAERDRVPIFESAKGIVWVGGLRIADWAKPRPDTRTLFLCYKPVTD
jgi:tRNA(Ile)-lysidine synthase